MTYVKSMLLALAATGALAGSALAQGDGGMMQNGSVMMFMPDGRMVSRKMTDQAMIASMVQKGKPLAAGQILVMSGGKVYILDDSKMANGKMFSEILMSAN